MLTLCLITPANLAMLGAYGPNIGDQPGQVVRAWVQAQGGAEPFCWHVRLL
jgi:hypothetical protein